MRLSIIVRNNLEKDGESNEYHAATSSGAPSGDVKLNHTDAELDFEEQTADGAGQSSAVLLHCVDDTECSCMRCCMIGFLQDSASSSSNILLRCRTCDAQRQMSQHLS